MASNQTISAVVLPHSPSHTPQHDHKIFPFIDGQIEPARRSIDEHPGTVSVEQSRPSSFVRGCRRLSQLVGFDSAVDGYDYDGCCDCPAHTGDEGLIGGKGFWDFGE